MWTIARSAKGLSLLTLVGLALFAGACQPEDSSKGGDDSVSFAGDTLSSTVVEPGDMLAIDVNYRGRHVEEGFFVRFSDGTNSVVVPPLHVGAGQAFVMVPPMPQAAAGVELALVTDDGDVKSTHAQTISIGDVESTMRYTRGSFDSAVGQGLARVIGLANECLDTLEQESIMPATDAATARGAIGQWTDMLADLNYYNDHLSDSELAMLQQLLDNMGILEFLADAGGVSLGAYGSQTSPLKSVVNAMIESALLKADFSSFLLGEFRGALTLLAYVMNQISGWPFIGNWAQGVATWATGLAATLKTPHDLINSMIPCDLVDVQAGSIQININQGATTDVYALGRFETQDPFNQQLFTQTVSTAVNTATTWVVSRMNNSQTLAPFSGYVQQTAQQVPTWINNWLQQNGYLQNSVVPGQNYTVLTIDNFNLDMSQYLFNTAGIVANLLNLPYSAVNAFFNWIGVSVGQPVGGFEGVGFSNGSVAGYLPSQDKIQGVATGSTTVYYKGVVCQEATGWWGQWGFYSIRETTGTIPLYVS